MAEAGRGISERLSRWLNRRNLRYGLTALLILALTVWATPWVDAHLNLEQERNWLFQHLTITPTNPRTAGKAARLVIIKDDEFWLGDLHHRIPTDRRYLARVVRALDAADASVIALDFDLRTPTPAAAAPVGDFAAVDTYDAYRLETNKLIEAIDDVAQRRKVVLAKTIAGPDNGPFRLQSDAYEPYGICIDLIGDGAWRNPGAPGYPLLGAAPTNISCGYIALMDDARRVPPPAHIVGQSAKLNSFAMAIARARDPANAPRLDARPYYGPYIEGDLVNDPHVTVSAHDLLNDPTKARAVLQGWPVIVGAGWRQRGVNSGPFTDVHPTPIGEVSGALIHENLAEALLTNRIYPGLNDTSLKLIELLAGGLAAVLFAAITTLWKKVCAVVVAMAAMFALQWLALQLFGAFVDAYVAVFALGLHALFDRMVGEHGDHSASSHESFAGRLRHGRMPAKAGGSAHAPLSGPRASE